MKMINLLNGKEFVPKISIRERLEEASKDNALIYTNRLRDVGKTYNLVIFAKKNNYTVIVPSRSSAVELREYFSYENIFDECARLEGIKNVVIDEGVNEFGLKGCKIVTGFTNIKEGEFDKSLDDEILESLRSDARKILKKLELIVSNGGSDSNYKMLINNLRETKELIDATNKVDTKVVNISNINVPSIKGSLFDQKQQAQLINDILIPLIEKTVLSDNLINNLLDKIIKKQNNIS
jgi:hypothetical protein